MNDGPELLNFVDNSNLSKDWRLDAACRGLDPEMFHQRRGESVKEAIAVCAGCLIVKECLHYALSNGIKVGVWGGTSEKQRRKMRRDNPNL